MGLLFLLQIPVRDIMQGGLIPSALYKPVFMDTALAEPVRI